MSEESSSKQNDLKIFDVIPGAELQRNLEAIFPKNSSSSENRSAFIEDIDDALKLDGNLVDLVYQSLINYLIRRLINTADYYKRKFSTDDYPAELYVEELRNFFQSETNLESNQVERLIAILQLCLAERDRKRRTVKRENIKQSDSIRCYICGTSLEEKDVEVEHQWPKDWGGSYDPKNLKVSCSACNSVKENYINSGDFHFEHISLRHDKEEANFLREFKGVYRIAVCSHNSYSCSSCGKPASELGRLDFMRKNPKDSWHFLNILTICNECQEK